MVEVHPVTSPETADKFLRGPGLAWEVEHDEGEFKRGEIPIYLDLGKVLAYYVQAAAQTVEKQILTKVAIVQLMIIGAALLSYALRRYL